MIARLVAGSFVAVSLFGLAASCGGSDPPPPQPVENTGSACTTPAQCYPNVDQKATPLKGEVQCLDRVVGGYCTHLCTTDADCCAVPGECRTGTKQVCSPFESTGKMMCFLSCEGADIAATPEAGTTDPTAYCHKFANAAFSCRSSGGGSKNRKVCVP